MTDRDLFITDKETNSHTLDVSIAANLWPFWWDQTWLKTGYFNWLNSFPLGWCILVPALSEAIIQAADKDNFNPRHVHFSDIKEKFGTLRIYGSASPSVNDVFLVFEHLSNYFCLQCGRPVAHEIPNSMSVPICDKCFDGINYTNDFRTKFYKHSVKPELDFEITSYDGKVETKRVIDCRPYYKRILETVKSLNPNENVDSFEKLCIDKPTEN